MLRQSIKPIKEKSSPFGVDEKGGFTLFTTAQLKSLDNQEGQQQRIS